MQFFVAFVATLACAFASPSAYAPYPYAAPAYPAYSGAYAHAPAPVTVLPSGFLADTPEVAHAKAAHLAEKAKVASSVAYAAPAPYAYAAPAYAPYAYAAPYAGAYAHGPAQITVLPSGYLADTPEVAHAKAAHFAEKAKSAAAAAANPDYESYAYAPAPYAYAAPKYYGSHY
ncbi:hypothetical protein M8J76_007502 [Diaphorina citri]|nr:hypothetical protein M8J76_007502 [Diaphorina citri]KAI5743777.1 hypothetical protein M8J77_022056 [Diaphorina citri]